jgi:adenylate kinase family enzyme
VSEPPPDRPRRVVIIGTSGAGKTVLSGRLAATLGVQNIELDALFWLPGWQEPEDAEFWAKVDAATDGEGGWVVDGNYSRVQDLVFARADTVVWLDLPMWTCLWRVFRRAVSRAHSGELMWGTNRERWGKIVGPGSLTSWVITTHRSRRRRNEERFAEPQFAHLRVQRFRSSGEADRWVASL